MHKFLQENRITVGSLWHLLQRYERELRQKDTHIKLYPHLKKIYRDYNDDTDNENGELDKIFSDGDDMVVEPLGCAPGEAVEASPDYRADTP